MSTIPLLPRYFVGTWQSHLDFATTPAALGNPGEYHLWTPDATPTPDSLVYVVMKSSNGVPHRDWYPLPHILDSTPVLKAWAGVNHVAVSNAIAHGLITQADTTFTTAQKLHAQMGIFLP